MKQTNAKPKKKQINNMKLVNNNEKVKKSC